MTVPPPPAPVSAPRRRGCAVIALGVGGVLLLLVLVLAYVGRESLSKTAQLLKEARRNAHASQLAPGAQEVREALGCHRGAVTDMRPTYAIAGIADAGVGMDLLVTCDTRQGYAEPSCEEVAEVYVGAVGRAPMPFLAVVRREETNVKLCQEVFAPDGSRM